MGSPPSKANHPIPTSPSPIIIPVALDEVRIPLRPDMKAEVLLKFLDQVTAGLTSLAVIITDGEHPRAVNIRPESKMDDRVNSRDEIVFFADIGCEEIEGFDFVTD